MDQFTDVLLEPQKMIDLIEQDKYAVVANLLKDIQFKSPSENDVQSVLLTIVLLVCQTMMECRSEIEWHRHAERQALARADNYKQLLNGISELLVELKNASPDTCSLPLKALETSASAALVEQGTSAKKISSLVGFLRNLLNNRLPQPESDRTVIASALKQMPVTLPGDLPRFVIYCLGSFKVYRDHQLINNWPGVKATSVFKYLILHRESPIPKDRLMDLFWADATPEAARRNLHQAIYTIRRTLREGCPDFQSVKFENDCYFLDPDISIWVDYEEFSHRAKTGLELEKKGFLAEALVEYSVAEGLYQNDFLEEDLYEDWTSLTRQQLRDTFLELASRLSEHYLHQAEYTAAMALCHKIMRFDRCQESAYRRLMKCYVAQGQRHLAIRQYLTCLEVLKQDLDIFPSEETVTLYKRLVEA
ncbi:MAG: hypothetical protein K8L99_16705 [Anaerolineae bacterium]|nr:hypothetical protein [Anaerolineae bacterium]